MNRILFITGSDTNQFDLALNCINSIIRNVTSFEYHIAFLDLGCIGKEIDLISNHVQFIKKPVWEFGITNNIPELECRKGQICRPFLRDYFPGYDTYIWIDADAWVQDGSCIDLYVKGANRRSVAIVSEMERSSKFFHGALAIYLQSMLNLYKSVYNDEIANNLYHMVNFNAGVFAFSRNSFAWDAWKSALEFSIRSFLQKNPSQQTILGIFGLIDQMALNLALRSQDNISDIEILPLRCNWTCHLSTPCFDEEKRMFVEPYLPNDPIGILHLTNPWGGKVGELNEPHKYHTTHVVSNVSGKMIYDSMPIETLSGSLLSLNLKQYLPMQ